MKTVPSVERVPFLEPSFGDSGAIFRKFREIVESGRITLGRYTEELEGSLSSRLGVREAIAVSSCTSGVMLALRAMELTGEVLLPSFTFGATAHPLIWCGLDPVFCECEEDSLSLDCRDLERKISARATAVLPVYIFGNPPDWDAIQKVAAERGLRVVADSAQGLGSSYRGRPAGGFGDLEVFSLGPTKPVTAAEGGVVTTNDRDLAGRIRQMRDYGKAAAGEDMDWIGLSCRMSEFHAVLAVENLKFLETWIERRRNLVQVYREELSPVPGIRFPGPTPGSRPSWTYLVIRIEEETAGFTRDELAGFLREKGVRTKRYFFPPVHRLRAYRRALEGRIPPLPVTERISRETLALPLFSHLAEDSVHRICSLIHSLAGRK